MPQLRTVDIGDLAALARLHALCFPDDRWDERAFSDLLGMPGASGHLIEDSHKSGNSGILGLILDLFAAEHGEILTLGTSPTYRRQGLAQLLLLDLFARAQRANIRTISLEVASDNIAARALYEQMGFVQVGRRRGYYRLGARAVDALILRWTTP